MSDDLITTKVASERLGVSQERVRQFIVSGRLPAQQIGRDHLIRESDLALVAERKTGRPKKEGAVSAKANNVIGAKAILSSKTTRKATKKRV